MANTIKEDTESALGRIGASTDAANASGTTLFSMIKQLLNINQNQAGTLKGVIRGAGTLAVSVNQAYFSIGTTINPAKSFTIVEGELIERDGYANSVPVYALDSVKCTGLNATQIQITRIGNTANSISFNYQIIEFY